MSRILKFGMSWLRRNAIKNKTPLEQYLLDCRPFKAKKHLREIDSMFIALNACVAKEQHVRISLKVPKK